MRASRLSFVSVAATVAGLSVVAPACEHAPPEDFSQRPSTSVAAAATPVGPAASAASPVAKGSPGAAGTAELARAAASTAPAGSATAPARCMLPTPAQPPPAVAPGPAPGCPRDPEPPAPTPALARVAFPDANGGAAGGVDVEIVSSEHDTQRGLMFRTSLPENRGMLFDLRVRDDHKFWMHNTCIPLDLLYIDDDGFITGIVENAPTLNDQPRGVGCPSLYVLEVNAGWSRRHGVRAGQMVTLPLEVRHR